MKIKNLWIVTNPFYESELVDILFKTDIRGLYLQFIGGLKSEDVVGVFTDEKEAKELALKLLKQKNKKNNLNENKKINLNELKQIIKQIINENSNNPDIDFKNFLKDRIEFEDYHNIYINNENLLETGFNVFLDEKMYEIKRIGIKKAFIDYIKGLPNWIDVPMYYYDIKKLLYAIGYDVNDMDDKEIDNFYYNKIADIFLKHVDKSELKINESRQVIKENIEPELNIIGNIKKTKIKGEVPSGAEYALLNPSGKSIQKFYKFEDVKFSDGTTNHTLKYYGEQGEWHPSTYNDKESRDYQNLKNNKFLKII